MSARELAEWEVYHLARGKIEALVSEGHGKVDPDTASQMVWSQIEHLIDDAYRET